MEIVPSILTDDPHEAALRLRRASRFSRSVQVDFMDGRFVPGRNTITPDALFDRDPGDTELIAHLLTFNPMSLLEGLKKARFRRIIFHLEAAGDRRPDPTAPDAPTMIEKARGLGFDVGLAKNPDTPAAALEPFRRLVDEWLFLAVDPRRPGVFIPGVLDEITRARKPHPGLQISIDGGLGAQNIADAARSGADVAYVGHSIFDGGGSPGANFETLRRIARSAK